MTIVVQGTDGNVIRLAPVATKTIVVKAVGPAGPGVPRGGTTGQLLLKGGDPDFQTEWHTLTKADIGLGNADDTADLDKPVSQAAQLALDDLQDQVTVNKEASDAHAAATGNVHDLVPADIGLGNVLDVAQIPASEKGAADGVAPLVDGKVPLTYLPVSLDDVLEFPTLGDFPATGMSGTLYVNQATNKVYRWSGSSYVTAPSTPDSTDNVPEGATNVYFTTVRARNAISVVGAGGSYDPSTGTITITGAVSSVAGRTGAVTLTTADVDGLGTIATQAASNVAVTGGTLNNTAIGSTTPAAGSFTTLTATTAGSTGAVTVTDTGANGANVKLVGNGATTPKKYIRANNGNLEVVNDAYSAAIATLTDAGVFSAARFVSTIAQGTAPFGVTSNTVVTNLNADLLDGQEGAYYQNASNLATGTVPAARLPIATAAAVGAIKVGANLSIDGNGVLSAQNSYVLPAATTTTLGGIKVGSGFSVDVNGLLSNNMGPGTITEFVFSATEGQTSFPIPGGFSAALTNVFNGGWRVPRTDWNGNDGLNVVLNTPCYGGEEVLVEVFSAQSMASSSVITRVPFTATDGQTTFPVTYPVGAIFPKVGVGLVDAADYTATDGANVVFSQGLPAGTKGEFIIFSQMQIANALPITGGSMAGNLDFAGTGKRITGDFSNATVASRLLFQTTAANTFSFLGVVPSGTGTASGYLATNSANPDNASGVLMQVSTTEARIASYASGTGTNLPMTFYTGGSERMRVDANGNVMIGDTSMYSTHTGFITTHASSDVYISARTKTAGNPNIELIADGVNAGGFFFDRAAGVMKGFVGAPSAGVSLAGGGTSWSAYSDMTLKTQLGTIESALSKVDQLDSIFYRFHTDDETVRRVGFSAQQVQAVLPEAVHEDAQGKLLLNYQDVIPLLAAALRELKGEFDAYKLAHP